MDDTYPRFEVRDSRSSTTKDDAVEVVMHHSEGQSSILSMSRSALWRLTEAANAYLEC